jgi:hypothetical protein
MKMIKNMHKTFGKVVIMTLVLSLFSSIVVGEDVYEVTVDTDKGVYRPGDQVIISGQLLLNGEGFPGGVCPDVYDPNGTKVYGEICIGTDGNGYYEVTDFFLDPGALIGVYNVSVAYHIDEFNTVWGNTTFKVTSHTVLGEVCSATWCPNCPTVHGWLDDLYTSGDHDFEYVSLVGNVNTIAMDRINELGVGAVYPTVVFDGGYAQAAGTLDGIQPYIDALNDSEIRDVADIDLDLDVIWQGDAKFEIAVTVTNNEATQYNGHLHVYACEISSRWNDNSGDPYVNAMLDYAYNSDVGYPPENFDSFGILWDGDLYGYGDIVKNNTIFIASIFREGTNYSDETAAAKDDGFVIYGGCWYEEIGGEAVIPVFVEIYDLTTGERWQAETNENYYHFHHPELTQLEGHTFRIITKDNYEYINVTEFTVTASDVERGYIQIDTVLDIHYLDLVDFPWYESQVDTGAAVGKQMLDYLMWNSTTHPDGPPDVYDENYLYTTYNSGDGEIDAADLAHLLNAEIDDSGNGWIYGYFFSARGHDLIEDALRTICIWVDFPVDYYNDYREVDVPKPGHPNHVPVGIPLEGTYDYWVNVRGIHTDQNCWPPSDITEPLNVYGLWINDPQTVGIGSNTYVTVEELTSDYYFKITDPGDIYFDMFVTVNDPPNIDGTELIDEETQEINFVQHPEKFNQKQSRLVRRAQMFTGTRIFTNDFVINAAQEGAWDVLKYSHHMDEFEQATANGKPVYNRGECTVEFINENTAFIVTIGSQKGELRLIQIEEHENINLLGK